MRYLLDECLSDLTARTMAVLGAPDDFAHLLDVAPEGTDDPDIPEICKREGFNVLISINVKDFGARKHIYEAVMAAGIHVLVLRRQPRQATSVYWQAALLARHYPKYKRLFEQAGQATLASMSDGGVRDLTLAEIMAEIEAQATGVSVLP